MRHVVSDAGSPDEVIAASALPDYLTSFPEVDGSTAEWRHRSYGAAVAAIGFGPKYLKTPLSPKCAMQVGDSFGNAFDLATTHPGLTYVEGYAVAEELGFVTHHAWVEDRAGRVIDPTWASLKLADNGLVAYLGIRFSVPFMMQHTGRAAEATAERGCVTFSVLAADGRLGCPLLRHGFRTDRRGVTWAVGT